MNKKPHVSKILILCLLLFTSTAFPFTVQAAETELTVLATTFPVFQIVRNVTEGREALKVDLMLPGDLGCPHDYAVTPQDMRKLATADVLVVNGLGLEAFLEAPVKQANPNIVIVDSSSGIKETLAYSGDHAHSHAHSHAHDQDHAHSHAHDHDHDHCHNHDHHHDHHHHHHFDVNPHLFASPRMIAPLAMNIAAGLSGADPDGASVYFRNARAYSDVMNRLADEMAHLGSRLKNRRIVQPHSVFDYLARDMGLEIVAVMQEHGHEPSASEMIHLIELIRKEHVGAIFIEPQYPAKTGNTLSRETGVPVALLDPVATGPENAPLDYYETVMRQNMKIIESTLGVK